MARLYGKRVCLVLMFRYSCKCCRRAAQTLHFQEIQRAAAVQRIYVEKNRLRSTRTIRKLGWKSQPNGGTNSTSYTMELDQGWKKKEDIRAWTPKLTFLNPVRTAVPIWGQITWNLTGLVPKRGSGSKRVKSTPGAQRYYYTVSTDNMSQDPIPLILRVPAVCRCSLLPVRRGLAAVFSTCSCCEHGLDSEHLGVRCCGYCRYLHHIGRVPGSIGSSVGWGGVNWSGV